MGSRYRRGIFKLTSGRYTPRRGTLPANFASTVPAPRASSRRTSRTGMRTMWRRGSGAQDRATQECRAETTRHGYMAPEAQGTYRWELSWDIQVICLSESVHVTRFCDIN